MLTIDPGSGLATITVNDVETYDDSTAVSIDIGDLRNAITLWRHGTSHQYPGGYSLLSVAAFHVEDVNVYPVYEGTEDEFVTVVLRDRSRETQPDLRGFLTPAAARDLRDQLNALDLDGDRQPAEA